MTQPAAQETTGSDTVAGGRVPEAFAAEVGTRLAALRALVPQDDGSLGARLFDRPGLVDSMLGRDLLDPLDLTPDVAPEGHGATGAGLPVAVTDLLRVVGPVGVEALDATIEAITVVRARVNALEALEAVLYERARRQALRAQLLDGTDPMVRTASSDRRRDLARRAVTADIALATHHTEHQVTARMSRAHALTARAPHTLTAALTGHVGWTNAAKVADTIDDLTPAMAATLDQQVAHAAACQNPRRFAATVRRTRDRLHPTPPQVRAAEATTKRGVWIDPGKDGMAWLTLHAPAPAIHAIGDRLDRTATHQRTTGDPRTLAQLRADTATALLLDDGTLDLTTLHLTDTAAPASTATDAGAPHGGDGDIPATDDRDDMRHGGAPPGSTAPDLAVLARSIRPHIYLTIPVLTLLDRADEPALLDGTVPIDPDTARNLAALAPSFTRILTHPLTGNVLAMDARTYTPPAALRRHLVVRDTTCRFPGCGRPATNTDADHTHAHAAGGATTHSNLALLCRHHHVLKHQTRYAATQTPDTTDATSPAPGSTGTLTWTTPTGRTYTTRPEPIPTTLHTTAPGPIHIPTPDDDPEHDGDGYGDDPDGDPPF
ncbi:HNH endonuclease [Xylanimonas cellulosilytica DSM 15894]|uniref:HNH endonuclease n=1 Tax=Xylanimonas cellulosilytica (strain DSM 15894 / JCM 12276 / CECT 5975 / KCTC 9989 / LMG 20990 / NBRC 107835 / XIL07) TaxID=446471 RepID=D1BW86_XYLCX|nr:HNH endonuclease signature motif containing protein [Xylanimonas cellulosilytica]ACZ31431.1 HNH endonuclease [Xylanimonas cellulosilytica DSM 15894]